MTNTTRALIVAHSSATRAGLRAMLESPDITVIAETSTLGDSFAFEIDVILSDDALPERSSLTSPALVLLSDLKQPPTRLLEARGWALVPSDASASELRAAVIASAQGLAVLPAHLAANLIAFEPEPALVRAEIDDTLEPFDPSEALRHVSATCSNGWRSDIPTNASPNNSRLPNRPSSFTSPRSTRNSTSRAGWRP